MKECVIGQKLRCDRTGCEWLKAFDYDCFFRPITRPFDEAEKRLEKLSEDLDNKIKKLFTK